MKNSLFAFLGVLALLVFASLAHAGELRTWTSRKGTLVEARFDRVSGNYIILQKSDGQFVKIEYSSLSDADQTHLRQGRSQPDRTSTPVRDARVVRPRDHPQPAVLPKNRWNLDDDDEQAAVVEEPVDQNRWQQINPDIGAAQLHEVNPLNAPGLGGQNQWGLQQGGRQQPNLQARKPHLLDQMQDPLQQDMWNPDAHDSHDSRDEWRQQQEQAERWRKQQEQESVQREKDMIKSRAFQLEGRIRDSRHSSHADYGGMSTEAEFLSQDASRLGESGAAWQFGNAASKLGEMEREDNSLWNRQQDSFGSQSDSNRREAERDVWGGSGSIKLL